ncbi:MAG: hypothetical protein Q8930_08355 [Bacillota bacterium]|nr:hypothetical protein [Bacillota bacterium]
MAELVMSMKELILVLKNALSNFPESKLKQIELVERNKIKVTISLSRLLPDIPATLAFHSFNNGTMKFEVYTSYPLKLVQPFINNMNLSGLEGNIITLEQNLLAVNIKEALKQSLTWLDITDIKLRNNNWLFTLSPSFHEE